MFGSRVMLLGPNLIRGPYLHRFRPFWGSFHSENGPGICPSRLCAVMTGVPLPIFRPFLALLGSRKARNVFVFACVQDVYMNNLWVANRASGPPFDGRLTFVHFHPFWTLHSGQEARMGMMKFPIKSGRGVEWGTPTILFFGPFWPLPVRKEPETFSFSCAYRACTWIISGSRIVLRGPNLTRGTYLHRFESFSGRSNKERLIFSSLRKMKHVKTSSILLLKNYLITKSI